MSWSGLEDWWISEVTSDSAYSSVVTPLLIEILAPQPSETYLDIGVGEGRVQREVTSFGSQVVGLDISEGLARAAGNSVVGEGTSIPVRGDTFDGVYCVLTLEHVRNHGQFFQEAARVTKVGGVLAIVMNHPIWTSPESTPITDQDGEVLWRPGDYFSHGLTKVPAGDTQIVFHHRNMASLLNEAARAGWALQQLIEQPHHELVDQAGIPRLLACRWNLNE